MTTRNQQEHLHSFPKTTNPPVIKDIWRAYTNVNDVQNGDTANIFEEMHWWPQCKLEKIQNCSNHWYDIGKMCKLDSFGSKGRLKQIMTWDCTRYDDTQAGRVISVLSH
jgi:hypothetical protein